MTLPHKVPLLFYYGIVSTMCVRIRLLMIKKNISFHSFSFWFARASQFFSLSISNTPRIHRYCEPSGCYSLHLTFQHNSYSVDVADIASEKTFRSCVRGTATLYVMAVVLCVTKPNCPHNLFTISRNFLSPSLLRHEG